MSRNFDEAIGSSAAENIKAPSLLEGLSLDHKGDGLTPTYKVSLLSKLISKCLHWGFELWIL
jgi:hypothetical protein